LQASQINDKLASLMFAEVDDARADDAHASQEGTGDAENAPKGLPEGNSTALVRLSVLEAVYANDRERWEQERRDYQVRIEALQREIGRLEGKPRKRPAWWARLFGE
jgi:hypothetical protein